MSKQDDPEGSFLGRWSRRKQQSQVEEPESPTTVPVETTMADQEILDLNDSENDAREKSSEDDAVDEKVLTDEDMVPIESLNADSDYSPFFSEGVSKQLRNMALKRLFFSGKFAHRDGLDDYDDDFTRFEPLGDTVTSDMKFHQRRKEKARLAKLEEERLEREKQLAEEESHQNSEQPEDSEETEVSDQPEGEDATDDPLEPAREEQPGQSPVFADGTDLEQSHPEQGGLPNDASNLSSGSESREKHTTRLTRTTPSGDDSNKLNREKT